MKNSKLYGDKKLKLSAFYYIIVTKKEAIYGNKGM